MIIVIYIEQGYFTLDRKVNLSEYIFNFYLAISTYIFFKTVLCLILRSPQYKEFHIKPMKGGGYKATIKIVSLISYLEMRYFTKIILKCLIIFQYIADIFSSLIH